MNTISPDELAGSRFADTQEFPGSTNEPIGPVSELSLARAVTTDNKSRAWRITLARLDRIDTFAPNLQPLFVAQTVSYTAGALFPGDVIPPRRDNPVFSALSPGNGSDIEPTFVQIAWGMSGSARCKLVAHWPVMGASIVVEGSYVEVFAGGAVFGVGIPPTPKETYPKFSAHITPVDGLSSEDAGELSIQQAVTIQEAGGFDGLDTNGVAAPAAGFFVGDAYHGGLTHSAVYGVGPWTMWQAIIKARIAQGTPTVWLSTAGSTGAPPDVEVRDHFAFDASGTFVPSPGDVAIRINQDLTAGSTITVAALEAAINTSTLVVVSSGDPSTTAIIQNWDDPVALPTVQPSADPNSAFGEILSLTEGGTVYVPDFARRVRVQLLSEGALEGPPACQLAWWDDQGILVDVAYQGAQPGGGTLAPDWQPVPARAVLLQIYGDPAESHQALVHWRIAP